jgi:arylsulfatase A-like enzyme
MNTALLGLSVVSEKHNLVYMKYSAIPFAFFASFMLQSCSDEKPNVILVLVDDMGYSDIGCYGGEIPTPNIDALAQNGIRFNNFHNTARCCPTRASLLTGLYQHQTGIGQMTSEGGSNFDFGVEGYRGYMNKKCVTIAEVLKDNGYHTYMTGKWHLGSDTLYKRPLQRGFEHFFGSYQGAFSYFDPKGIRCLIDETDTIRAPKGFYTTDAFTDKAIGFIKSKNDKNPFFLYLAYNAPHWPLHAKDEDIQKFVGKFTKGWDVLRRERFERQLKMGLFDANVQLTPRDERVRPWGEVSDEQKAESDYRMAVYAAQIYCVDYNIGKLVQYLKESNQFENTLIMFLSDNGACAEPYKEFGGGDISEINDPDKTGAVSYGIGWANLSNTPFRNYKVNAEEGGIATPFIAHWPKGITTQRGKITSTQGHIINIMPTILEIAGAAYPQTNAGNTILPLEGKSLLPTFMYGSQPEPEYQFWEHSYNCAVRKGNWKAISRVGSDEWKLFNLETDRTELNDVAALHPDIVRELAAQWHQWSVRCKVVPKGTKTKNSYN